MTKTTKPKWKARPGDLVTSKPSLTKQDGARTPAQAMRQYLGHGILPKTRPAVYADVSRIDAAATRDALAAFRSDFDALPADLRDRFADDELNYLDFLEDNNDLIEKDGLGNVLRDLRSGEFDRPEQAPEISTPDNSAGNGATDGEPATE